MNNNEQSVFNFAADKPKTNWLNKMFVFDNFLRIVEKWIGFKNKLYYRRF